MESDPESVDDLPPIDIRAYLRSHPDYPEDEDDDDEIRPPWFDTPLPAWEDLTWEQKEQIFDPEPTLSEQIEELMKKLGRI